MKWLKILLIGGIFLSLRVPRAVAATFQMQTGYYVGDGTDDRTISGIGFQPELIFIKDDTTNGNEGVIWKSTAMSGEVSAKLGEAESDLASNAIQSFASDGFVLGTEDDVNGTNIRFTWVAFRGSDCTSSGTFCVNSYTGTGSTQSLTSVGFQPNMVMVKKSSGGTARSGCFRTSAMGTNESNYFSAANNTTTAITSLDATGFTVGTDTCANETGGATYWYTAFKTTASAFAVGTFTGDGAASKVITVGFAPQYTWVKNSDATVASVAYFNLIESNSDHSGSSIDANNLTGVITSLDSNGFTVGSNAAANENTKTLYWFAFGGATNPSGSGTYNLKVGSYTGNGTSQSFSSFGFAPDLVIIKDEAGANYAVFRTRLMKGDSTAYLANLLTNFAGGITSLDGDGFSIGADATVNTNSTVYHYQAFGNAFNPEDNTGSADFTIGAYNGNGGDDRNILRLPFQPDLVAVKVVGNLEGIWRTSAQTGDLSVAFSSRSEGADYIQALQSTGFQIGGASRVNSSNFLHHYFAFKASSTMVVNNYTGTASAQNITTPGFNPNLVWIRNTGSVNAVFRPSTLAGDSTQYFANSAAAADRITAMISTGFSVGGNQTETNTASTTYRYAAWLINTAPATPSLDSPADGATNQSLTPALLTTTTDTANDYLRYKIEICTNAGMSTGCLTTIDQTSSQTGWSGQNAQTSTAYTSGTQATHTIQSALTAATTYYWRSYAIDPGGTNTWSGTQTPRSFTTSAAPSVSSISVNGGANIALTEGTTTSVSWVGTVTDTNGYATISSANGVLYRSGVAGSEVCTPSNNNCYADASCTLSGCSGNSCTATCSVDVTFFAEPTDASSAYASEYWRGWIKGTDSVGVTGAAFSTAGSPELESMAAMSVTSSITYDPLLAGDDTGATNESTTITNTGNTILDAEVSGDNFCTNYPTCSGYQIAVGYQEYKMTGFTYGLGTALSATPTVIQLNLAKATVSPSNSSTTLYWGMGIPSPKESGSYSGANLITAVDGD